MPLAIDIGTRALKLVQGKASKNGIVIKQAIVEPLPSGLVQDGIIREFGGLEMAMKNMLAKHKIRDKACSLTINGSHIYNRELDVPNGKEKLLDDVISFEVKSALNNNKDVAVEYVKSKQVVPDHPEMVHIRASALQIDYINDYHKLMKNLGLSPVSLDLHPNALAKAIASTSINGKTPAPNGEMLLIDMGGVSTTAYVFVGGELIYSRIIPVGGLDIERYVIRHNEDMPVDQQIQIEKLDLSLEKLRSNENLANAVRPMVSTVNDGIQRIQQFVAGRLQANRIEQAYLYGRTALYPNLDKTMAAAFNFPAETINSIGKVKMPNGQSVAPYVNAIGALIRID